MPMTLRTQHTIVVHALHTAQQPVRTGTRHVERRETRLGIALDTRPALLLAYVARLSAAAGQLPTLKRGGGLTSFHRDFGIVSTPSIGSMYTELLTPTSGIQIAHKRCAQAPLLVCLYAPPSFGQKMQSCAGDQRREWQGWIARLTTGFSGSTVHFRQSHWPSGMYGTP